MNKDIEQLMAKIIAQRVEEEIEKRKKRIEQEVEQRVEKGRIAAKGEMFKKRNYSEPLTEQFFRF